MSPREMELRENIEALLESIETLEERIKDKRVQMAVLLLEIKNLKELEI